MENVEQSKYEDVYKNLNNLLFEEDETKDSALYIMKIINMHINNLRNIESSNSITIQFNRINSIRMLLKTLEKHCDEAEYMLNEVIK